MRLNGTVALVVMVLFAAVLGCSGKEAADTPPTTVAVTPTSGGPAPPIEPVSGGPMVAGTVEDDALGFSFGYPAGWQVFVSEGPFPDQSIKKVVSLTKKIMSDGSEVSVDVEFTVKEAVSLADVTGKVKDELEGSGLPLIEETPLATVDGVEGLTIRSGVPEWKLKHVVLFAEGLAYVFKYSSQDALYAANEAELDGMVASFAVR